MNLLTVKKIAEVLFFYSLSSVVTAIAVVAWLDAHSIVLGIWGISHAVLCAVSAAPYIFIKGR